MTRTKINGWTIQLDERDRYNDYSVVADHFVSVTDPRGNGHRYDCGTDRSKALKCFNAAIRDVKEFLAAA